MKQIFVFLMLVYLILIACDNNKNDQKTIEKESNNEVELLNYDDFKAQIKDSIKNSNLNQKQTYFFQLIDEKIPAYWLGTEWDFNGTTRTPKQGTIACGYFVTNILDDLGFKINRISLAQAVSSKMIEKLCKSSTIKRFSDKNKMEQYVLNSKLEQEIFIIGLDFHTGWIVKNKNKIYFLHADYLTDKVIKEETLNSPNLLNSKSFMIGSISQNENLITNWK